VGLLLTVGGGKIGGCRGSNSNVERGVHVKTPLSGVGGGFFVGWGEYKGTGAFTRTERGLGGERGETIEGKRGL